MLPKFDLKWPASESRHLVDVFPALRERTQEDRALNLSKMPLPVVHVTRSRFICQRNSTASSMAGSPRAATGRDRLSRQTRYFCPCKLHFSTTPAATQTNL